MPPKTPNTTIAIILAAGKGTRLKSKTPKVLHDILGKPIIHRCLDTLTALSESSHPITDAYIVVGHMAKMVEDYINQQTWPFKITFVTQEPQLGTGHAVQQVAQALKANTEAQVLITCGDTPCIPVSLYQESLEHHKKNNAALTIVSSQLDTPGQYGRVIFNKKQQFEKIVEAKDATPEEIACPWINTGIYIADWPLLNSVLGQLRSDNAQKEYYLTDAALLLKQAGENVSVCTLKSKEAKDDIIGINSREELTEAITIFTKRKITELQQAGVTIIQPSSTVIAPEVTIEPDTVIYPSTSLIGKIHIGADSFIGPCTTLKGRVLIGEGCTVSHSYIQNNVEIGQNNYIGPFAHIRDNTVIHNNCRIGNYVEIKQTELGSHSNAAHLSYLGDASIGENVNMGAGSIIANYDPILDKKYDTQIKDGVKVGCNSTLIAPLTIEQNACIAAGSTITKHVEENDLAIARTHQNNIPQWVKRKKSTPVKN